MIVIPCTRGFSSGNWQPFLTNITRSVAPDGVYIAWGAGPFGNRSYTEPDKRARQWFVTPHAMNKQISGMEPLILCERKTNANTESRFYPDQDTHS